MQEENKNHFIYKRIFPDVQSILGRKGENVDKIFKKALFVLDTNSLLVPYNTGKENIEEIRKIYEMLISNNRLFIPEHVLREFAKNRSLKIMELYTNIDNQLSTIPTIKTFEYPILGELEAYKKLKDSRDTISENIKVYKDNLKELKSGVTNWNWSDPVTSMYQNTFLEKTFIKSEQSEEDLINEYNQRLKDDIPPGNKDKSKNDNAIGDFVIWKSILELGKLKKKDIIFVSNDEKNDWLLKGNKKSISTKFELVDEFYRHTKGKNFISMTFSEFLERQGLVINIADVFKQFEDIFPTPNNSKISDTESYKSLGHLDIIFTQFLIENEDNLEDSNYINGSINSLIDTFNNSYQKEFYESPYWREYYEYFFFFNSSLTEIKALNNEIAFQEIRMKRDTRIDTIKLISLVKEFKKKFYEFKIIV